MVYAAVQMDGPGLNYIRASYRKQAAQVVAGNSRMLRNRAPAEAQAWPLLRCNFTSAARSCPLSSDCLVLRTACNFAKPSRYQEKGNRGRH